MVDYLVEDMATASELTTLHATLEERVKNHIRFFWAVAAGGFIWLVGISGALYYMTGTVSDIKSLLAPQRLQGAAIQPTSSKNQKIAKDILSKAQQKSIPEIPASVVERAGKSFIKAASKPDPQVWEVALDFMSYRSSLNAARQPSPFTTIPSESLTTHYHIGTLVPGKPKPAMKWMPPLVPAEEAARYDHIGQDENTGVKMQPRGLFLSGGAASLDGEQIRNIVFERVEIHYSGMPVILENVLFINCSFVFDNSDRSRQLGETLLTTSPVTFRAIG